MRLRKVGLVLGIAGSVMLGSSVAWATTMSSGGIDVCVPKAGAVSALGPNGECPKGATRVTIGDLDAVHELEARLATLEGAAGGADDAAGATEARVVTQSWVTPTCPNVTGWHFVTCKSDPSEPQFAGPDYSPPNTDYGLTVDASNYPEGTTWAMDLRYLTRGQTCVRLFDVTANAPVAGSEHCVTGTPAAPAKGRMFGPSFALPSSSHDYLLQSTNSMYCLYDWYCTSAGSIKVRELVANW